MEVTYVDIVGWMAASLTTISFLPQAIKTIRTKNTHGISLLMYAIFTVGVICWAIFGTLIKTYVIVAANIITFLLASTILVIKIKNVINGSDK